MTERKIEQDDNKVNLTNTGAASSTKLGGYSCIVNPHFKSEDQQPIPSVTDKPVESSYVLRSGNSLFEFQRSPIPMHNFGNRPSVVVMPSILGVKQDEANDLLASSVVEAPKGTGSSSKEADDLLAQSDVGQPAPIFAEQAVINKVNGMGDVKVGTVKRIGLYARFENQFKKISAVIASVLVILLAITHIVSSDLDKQSIKFTAMITNAYDFLQSKSARQNEYKIALRDLEVRLAANPNISGKARALIEGGIEDYKNLLTLSESDPASKEGRLEVLQRAQALENARNYVLVRAPWFDYAQGILGGAILLLAIAIIAGTPFLTIIASLFGLLGVACVINGFYLFWII